MLSENFTLPQDLGSGATLKVEPPRVNQDAYSSEYLILGTLSRHRIRVRHSIVKATSVRPAYDRHNVEVVETVYATATEAEFDRKVYFVIENLPSDADNVDLNIHGLATWLQTGTNMAQLIGWES